MSAGFACLLLSGCVGSSWQEFVSQEGDFRVLMPGTPCEEDEELAAPFSSLVHKFLLESGDTAYMVCYVDHTEAQNKPCWRDDLETCRFLLDLHPKASTNGAVALRTTLGRPVRQGGHAGRETLVEVPALGRADRNRTFVVGRRLYFVRVAGPKESVTSAEADRFLDSFTIQNGKEGYSMR
jgi:hypothetical protein